jgi:hypothetical protein
MKAIRIFMLVLFLGLALNVATGETTQPQSQSDSRATDAGCNPTKETCI